MSSFGGATTLGINVQITGADKASDDLEKLKNSVGGANKEIDKITPTAEKAGINLKKLSFAVFGLSLSVTNIITSMSRFENQVISIDKKTIQLERTKISLRQQVERLKKAYDSGSISQEQYAISLDRIRQTEEQVKLKTRELDTEQRQLTDTWINFAANIASSVLFSFVALQSALKGVTVAQIQTKLSTIATSNAFKMLFLDTTAASVALHGMKLNMSLTTIASIGLGASLRGLGASIKSLLAAIPVFGWIALGVTTALEVTMLYSEEIKGLIGMETDAAKQARLLAESQGSVTDEFGELNDVLDAGNSKWDTAITKMQKTVDELNKVRGAVQSTSASWSSGGGGTGQGTRSGGASGTGGQIQGGVSGGNGLIMIPQTPGEALISQGRDDQFNSIQKYLMTLRETYNVHTDVRSAIQDELNMTHNITEKRKILSKIQEAIKLSYTDSNGKLTEEGRLLDRALNLERNILDAKEKKLKSQLEHNKALKTEAEIQEELKKKQESLYKNGILFLSQAKTFAREMFEVARNRLRLFDELGKGLEGSAAGFLSGILNQNTGGFDVSKGITRDLVGLSNLFQFQADTVEAGDLQGYAMIQVEINKLLRGRNLSGGIRSISQQMSINLRNSSANSDVGRLSNRLSNQSIGRLGGSGGSSVAFGGSRSKGRPNRGSKSASNERQARQWEEGINAQAFGEFGDVFTMEEIKNMYLVHLIPAQRGGPGRSWAFSGWDGIRAEATRRRREQFLALQSEVRAGLETRLSREERFAAHVGQFGAGSVSAGGGTAMNFAELMPFFQQMIREVISADDRQRLESLMALVKNK